MPNPAKAIKLKPRRCKYCKLNFVPVCRNEQQRTNAEAQIFCCANHRKSYHLNGGINFDQLIEKAAAKIRETLSKDDKFIAAVRDRLIAMERSPTMADELKRLQQKPATGPVTVSFAAPQRRTSSTV